MPTCAIVVMPCFNEQANIFATCHSLGFSQDGYFSKINALLVIVDNNSTDQTNKIAHEVKSLSLQDQVYIIDENEQGVIQARITGNQFAISISQKVNLKTDEILILQVDADTIYPPQYIEIMVSSAESYGKNIMVESCVDYGNDFRLKNGPYINLLEQTDARYDRLYQNLHDYIVDDKVVAYWLSDYIIWGGHIREFTLFGDEIFAETTRLFLRAQAKGAMKKNVGSIRAYHSERKVIDNPSMHFATAGFPRETTWDNFWLKKKNLTILENINEANFSEPIFFRILHLIALFYILPIHVDRTLKYGDAIPDNELSKYLQDLLPGRSVNDLQDQPGLFLSDVFAVIDKNPQLIKEKVDDYLGTKT